MWKDMLGGVVFFILADILVGGWNWYQTSAIAWLTQLYIFTPSN